LVDIYVYRLNAAAVVEGLASFAKSMTPVIIDMAIAAMTIFEISFCVSMFSPKCILNNES